MTPAARIEEMAANIAELRSLPPCELAGHAREITGHQDEQAVCWRCHAVVDIRDAWPTGHDFECTNEQECNERAAADAESEDAEFIYEAARGRGATGGTPCLH